MKYKLARKFLAEACIPMLQEMRNELPLTDDEALIFEKRYLELEIRVRIFSFIHPMSESTYNKKHNSLLSKIESWLEYKNSKV